MIPPEFLAAVPTVGGVLLLLGAAYAQRVRGARRKRRETAITRHPSWQARRRKIPGLPVDGEPLSEEDLAEFTQIMMRPAQDQARETSADEGAE